MIDWTPFDEQAQALLGERLAGWTEKFPEVVVRRRIERDRPSAVLHDAANGAQLLVVGSRGHGGFAGLTLGSVSQAMLHHEPCRSWSPDQIMKDVEEEKAMRAGDIMTSSGDHGAGGDDGPGCGGAADGR